MASKLKTRGDGKYVYKKVLAVYAADRQKDITATDPSERTDDEHLILYLCEQLKFYQKRVESLVEREVQAVEDSSLDDLIDELALVTGRLQGIMDALRVHGYPGLPLAQDVAGWLQSAIPQGSPRDSAAE